MGFLLNTLLPLAFPLFGLLLLFKIPTKIYLKEKYKVGDNRQIDSHYDYIVVGAGSTGSVIASRLTENPHVSVLLLEAGGEENFITEIPGISSFMGFTPKDWSFKTVPQEHSCFGLKNQRNIMAAGRIIGGSSAINKMLYIRGNKKDYDDWERLGAHGWSYKDVLPYFIKAERNTSPFVSPVHGRNGPLNVEDQRYITKVGKAVLKASKYLGFETRDYNDGYGRGFRFVQVTSSKGVRVSSAKAYLRPIRRRKNLHVVTKAYVLKVVVNWFKHTEGVIFRHKRKSYFVRARREVILSAGAIKSPQILMLSGIGPKHELIKHKIPLIKDLAVGNNLQEHVGSIVTYVSKADTITIGDLFNPLTLINYLKYGRGTFVHSGIDVVGFFNSKYESRYDAFGDIEQFTVPLAVNTKIGQKLVGIKNKIFKRVFQPTRWKDAFMIVTALLKPKSRGHVRLKSSDPFDDPLINPRYLSHPHDAKALVEGVKVALSYENTPSFRKINARLVKIPIPGCQHYPFYSDAYIECQFRHITWVFYHQAGTCKMGSTSDHYSVVDPYLRVKGVFGLRVADASVMPEIPSGNTNAICIMIGEKAADIIRSVRW
ncbi:Uncharacterised protein at_DN1121 [Pycnogonum litorale]